MFWYRTAVRARSTTIEIEPDVVGARSSFRNIRRLPRPAEQGLFRGREKLFRAPRQAYDVMISEPSNLG